MTQHTVLAVDPGKVSGWAFVDLDDLATFTAGQLPHMEFLDMAERAIMAGKLTAIVAESYVITARSLKVSRGENWSLEQLGVLRWLCHKRDVDFTEQTAADGKRFGTDTKLLSAGWFHPTPGGHRNDACRHLLTYAANVGRLDAVLRYGREVRRGNM